MSSTLYVPSLAAVDAIVHAVETGQTITLTREQALEIYEALEKLRDTRNPCPFGGALKD